MLGDVKVSPISLGRQMYWKKMLLQYRFRKVDVQVAAWGYTIHDTSDK